MLRKITLKQSVIYVGVITLILTGLASAQDRAKVSYANRLVEVLRDGANEWSFLRAEIEEDSRREFLSPNDILRVPPRAIVQIKNTAGTVWWIGPPREDTVTELMQSVPPEKHLETKQMGPPRASIGYFITDTVQWQMTSAQLEQLKDPQRIQRYITPEIDSWAKKTLETAKQSSALRAHSRYPTVLFTTRTLFEEMWRLDLRPRQANRSTDCQHPQITFTARTATELDIACLYLTILKTQAISAEIEIGESNSLIVLINTGSKNAKEFSANARYTRIKPSDATVWIPIRISWQYPIWMAAWYEGAKYAKNPEHEP